MNDQEQQTKPGVGASVSTAELAISPSVSTAGLAISPSVTNAYGFYVNMPSREELRKVHSMNATNRVSELAIDFGDEVFFLGFDDFIALLKASNAEREERTNVKVTGALPTAAIGDMSMKTREEIAKFMEGQMSGAIDCEGKAAWHYGKCELRQLMDFIFDGPPTCKAEEVFEPLRLRNKKVGKWRD